MNNKWRIKILIVYFTLLKTIHLIGIYMYNTAEQKVQRSITRMSFKIHIIIR